jgi:hypothetical protein
MTPLKIKIETVKAIEARDDQRTGGFFGNRRCEPYLLTIYIKIDGNCINQETANSLYLRGKLNPEDVFMGDLKKIGEDVPSGKVLNISPEIAEWNTVSKPISINFMGKQNFVEGAVIAIYVFMEEDATATYIIRDAYNTLKNTVVEEVNKAITQINLMDYNNNGKFDYQKFTQDNFSESSSRIKNAVEAKIKDHILGLLPSLFRNDDMIGFSNPIQFFSIQELLYGRKNFSSHFNGEGTWDVNGYAKAGFVRVFEHINFEGSFQDFEIGSFNVNDLSIGNDTISSIAIPQNKIVELFEHSNFSGHKITLTEDCADFTTLKAHTYADDTILNPRYDIRGLVFNDETSSIKILSK